MSQLRDASYKSDVKSLGSETCKSPLDVVTKSNSLPFANAGVFSLPFLQLYLGGIGPPHSLRITYSKSEIRKSPVNVFLLIRCVLSSSAGYLVKIPSKRPLPRDGINNKLQIQARIPSARTIWKLLETENSYELLPSLLLH